MRVICITNKPLPITHPMYFDDIKNLEEGEVYTVVKVCDDGYVLAEIKSSHPLKGFNKDRFIPCSDIDETEMVRESNLIKI